VSLHGETGCYVKLSIQLNNVMRMTVLDSDIIVAGVASIRVHEHM
jgi:hypothetical protein